MCNAIPKGNLQLQADNFFQRIVVMKLKLAAKLIVIHGPMETHEY